LKIFKVFLILVSIALSSIGVAQSKANFPSEPIKIVVPFPPGGGADTLARVIEKKLEEITRQPILVENRPGASGLIGANYVAQSTPNGYTLVMGTTAAITDKNVSQFLPVALVSASPYLITVNPKHGFKNIQDLIQFAKSNPGAIKFGSSGIGSASHLSGELFNSIAGIEMLHVPYKGTGQALTDLLGGQIDVIFAPSQTVMPQVMAKKLDVLAQTGAKRAQSLASIPTAAETGLPSYESVGWFGVLAPKQTEASIVRYLNRVINEALTDKNILQSMSDRGIDLTPMSNEEFSSFLYQDQKKWSNLIKEKNIQF
jgi:tripartite-type tricarboxylate transporter receptor subunit TctC